MKTCRMCCSTVTLRRPSSHCTVKLSRPPPPPARPPPFSHCLSLRSSAQRGLTTRGFITATASVAQTERRHTGILNTHTYTSVPFIQPICTDGNSPAFISHSHSKQVILLYVKEMEKKKKAPLVDNKNKAETFRSLTQWWKQETHRGPDLSRPRPAGSRSDWPGQPQCMRSPWCSRSLWPTWEDQVWWTGQGWVRWTGSGRAQAGRVGTHC